MPRHTEPDLRKDWKISLPATLAGAVEFQLMDPITKKPRYAERSRIVAMLLSEWLAQRGVEVAVDLPSEDLRLQKDIAPHVRSPNLAVTDPIDPVDPDAPRSQ